MSKIYLGIDIGGTAVKLGLVDDTGTVFVRWDNGSGLGIVYGVDRIRKL